MSRALGPASPKLRSAVTVAAFASLYFLTAVLTDSLIGDAGVAVLWPASGLYLGVMLVSPHRRWRALVCAAGLGSLAAYLYGGSSLQVSVAFAVPSCAEGFLAALLVERIARKRFRLAAPHDLFALVVGGAVIANALIALSAGAVAAQTFHASFAESWLRWWSADALGMLAVAPIVTAPVRAGLRRPSRWWSGPRVAGLGGLGAALVAMQLVTKGGVDQVYSVQAFLAVLLLGSLGLVLAAAERARIREELGRAREGSAEERDRARRRFVQLTAELAARRAEVIQGDRGQEQLAERLREAERARDEAERARGQAERAAERAERELGEARSALEAAREEKEELGRDLGLTVADRDRAQTELRESTLALERLQGELGTATGELARARDDGRALDEQLERSRAETRALDDELESARMESRARQDELELARARTGALESQLEEALSERQALATRLDDARTGRRSLEEELERTAAELTGVVEQLAEAVSGRQRLEEELVGLRAEHARAGEELGRALYARKRLEEELRSTRAEHARTAEGLAESNSGRERAEEELAVVSGRLEDLERELVRARAAHQDAELALDHARARFAERREQLELALAEAAEKLERLEGQASDGAGEFSSRYDERGTCLSASPAFARLLGYEPGELLGRPGSELLHPDDRPRLARARASRSRTSFQARLRRKAGDFVWVEVSLDPVWSSGGERLLELRTTVRRFPLAA
jgi:PAS domain S-box-containing protein